MKAGPVSRIFRKPLRRARARNVSVSKETDKVTPGPAFVRYSQCIGAYGKAGIRNPEPEPETEPEPEPAPKK